MSSALSKRLQQFGQLPPVKFRIIPLDAGREPFEFRNFMSYEFNSSILIPVDSFSMSFVNPADTRSAVDTIKEGDIVELVADETTLATGIVDIVEIDFSPEGGEMITIQGRDLMCQLEDQSAVSVNDDPLWGNAMTIKDVVSSLIRSTKIRGLRLQDVPSGAYLFASEPGETKLSALQRFLEPLNCLAWMDPNGYLIVGRPNMSQEVKGRIIVDRETRFSNLSSAKVIRSSTQIPNIVVPIWLGQETVQSRVPKEQRINNSAVGPTRLRQRNYLVPKTIVVSTPQGSTAQDLSDVNQLNIARGTLLQAIAAREIARANIKELIVNGIVKGHYNDDLEAFRNDTTYQIYIPRGNVDDKMYLYSVKYSGDNESGIKTVLEFCKLNRITAEIATRTASTVLFKRAQLFG